MTKVKIINRSTNDLPRYETSGSAGMDVRAFIPDAVKIGSLERVLIPTGLYLELPEGTELQLRPRSGLAFKKGISLPNSPATIDSDYRGEIKVALINLSKEDQVVNPGDRIAQMILSKVEKVEWQESESITETERSIGGFGHTGIK